VTVASDEPFQLREVDRTKIYNSIVGQIHEGIRSGAFPSGSSLPPERTLAQEFGVSRSSVREAVRVLEHAGVLEVRTGSGTYVSPNAQSKASLLRVEAAASGQYSPIDIIAVRRALESLSSRLAAGQRTRQDLAALELAINTHAQLLQDGDDPSEADIRFHLLLGVASKNSLLRHHVEEVVAVLGQQLWRTMKLQSLSDSVHATTYLREHRKVLDAVKAGDGDAAAMAMNAHLDSIEEHLLALV
jgi:GntR family transcriptional regulator, transcriptional repressor for pyruvate dehydrogenase complex